MKRGRITAFTDARRKSILTDLENGNTRSCAAACAGICDRTLVNWLARGRKGEKPYDAFFADVKKAELKAERVAVAGIRKAGEKIWTAYAWWLERKNPASWASDAALIRDLIRRLDALEGKRRG